MRASASCAVLVVIPPALRGRRTTRNPRKCVRWAKAEHRRRGVGLHRFGLRIFAVQGAPSMPLVNHITHRAHNSELIGCDFIGPEMWARCHP